MEQGRRKRRGGGGRTVERNFRSLLGGWYACDQTELTEGLIETGTRSDNPNAKPLLPLDKEVMVDMLQPVSTAAFIGLSTSLAQAGHGLPQNMNVHVRTFLNIILYAFFPIGLASLIASVGVKRRPELIGWASGWLLFEFYFVTVIGGIVSVVKSGTSVWVMLLVTAALLVATTLIWCHCCSYPKCLRRLLCCGCNNGREMRTRDKRAARDSLLGDNGQAKVQALEGQSKNNVGGGVAADV